jgi:hypothetical protein
MSSTYDTRSIMHYPGAAPFGGGPLTSKPPGQILDTSQDLTATDRAFVHDLYPHIGIVRRSSSSDSSGAPNVAGAGAASQIATVHDQPGASVVTVVITKSGTLRLIDWSVRSDGVLQRSSDSAELAGAASSPAVAKDAGDLYVTACTSGSGALQLISWRVLSGEIRRLGDSGDLASNASLADIVWLDADLFITACRAGNGNLLLITWRVQADGSFARLADSGTQAGDVSEISLMRLRSTPAGHVVATAVRTASGNLSVICWEVPAPGNAVRRRGDSGEQIGAATQIALAVDRHGHLVASCRDASGHLLIVTLRVSGDARTISRLADSGSQAGDVSENIVLARPYGVLSTVRRANGRLLLIAWRTTPGGRVRRLGDSSDQAGAATGLAIAPARAADAPVVVALRRPSGQLLVTSWDDRSTSGEV